MCKRKYYIYKEFIKHLTRFTYSNFITYSNFNVIGLHSAINLLINYVNTFFSLPEVYFFDTTSPLLSGVYNAWYTLPAVEQGLNLAHSILPRSSCFRWYELTLSLSWHNMCPSQSAWLDRVHSISVASSPLAFAEASNNLIFRSFLMQIIFLIMCATLCETCIQIYVCKIA